MLGNLEQGVAELGLALELDHEGGAVYRILVLISLSMGTVGTSNFFAERSHVAHIHHEGYDIERCLDLLTVGKRSMVIQQDRALGGLHLARIHLIHYSVHGSGFGINPPGGLLALGNGADVFLYERLHGSKVHIADNDHLKACGICEEFAVVFSTVAIEASSRVCMSITLRRGFPP